MVRAVLGTLLLLVGLPLLLAGGLLWVATQHQDPAGGYSAELSTVSTEGHAVVSSDVDALLRREAAFTRAGRTTLRLTAQTATGPAFIGLAPAADVARYLATVPYARVEEVRLARGRLPVATVPVAGIQPPAGPPGEQPFWVASGTGELAWSPHELREQRLALVVMAPDGSAPLAVELTARVRPQWLESTTLGLLVLGTLLGMAAVLLLAWPARAREIVYVVPPARMPDIAARLGVPLSAGLAEPATVAATPPAAGEPSVGEPSVGEPSLADRIPGGTRPADPRMRVVRQVGAQPRSDLARSPNQAGPAGQFPGRIAGSGQELGARLEWPLLAGTHTTATPISVPPGSAASAPAPPAAVASAPPAAGRSSGG